LEKDVSQFRERTDVLQFEWNQYQEEESDLDREKREASAQIESLEGVKREGEEHVQSLKQQVEALRKNPTGWEKKLPGGRFSWPPSRKSGKGWKDAMSACPNP